MQKAEKFLIVIGGPTAVGKTSLAIDVAQHFDTEIVSCDSRQFYREMSIGTAKPSAGELAAAPHHFINSLSIYDTYTAGDFERDALTLLARLYEKHDVMVATGGSGLFIRALCEGLDDYPEVPSLVQSELETLYREKGIEALQRELKARDPVYFTKIDVNNPRRLLRALAVCRASGRPFSSFQKGPKQERPFTPVYVLLNMERAALYERIERRVDAMLAAGLLEEARLLFPNRHLKALQTVGYQELFAHFAGEIPMEKAVELIKQNSRRYAKRQMTWFRKDSHWREFSPDGKLEILHWIEKAVGSGF